MAGITSFVGDLDKNVHVEVLEVGPGLRTIASATLTSQEISSWLKIG